MLCVYWVVSKRACATACESKMGQGGFTALG